MKNYKVQQECIKCKKHFSASHKRLMCDDCDTLTPVLQRNNPEGYNKHKKSGKIKQVVLTQEEEFKSLDKVKQFEQIQELGNKIYREGKEVFKMKKKFSMMNKIYFNFNFKEEE